MNTLKTFLITALCMFAGVCYADITYYQQCTSVDEINADNEYIIVISDGTNSYAIQRAATNYYAVNIEGNMIKTSKDSLAWKVVVNNDGTYKFYKETTGDNSKYIYRSSNNSFSTVNASGSNWAIEKISSDTYDAFKIATKSTGIYIGWTGSAFTTYSNSNWKDQLAENGSLENSKYGALYIFKALKTDVNVTAAGYTTYYNSVCAYTMPENVEGYVAYHDSNNLFHFEPAYYSGNVVPAGTALVLKASEGTHTLEFTTGGTAPDNNELLGFDELRTPTATDNMYYYALSTSSSGEPESVGFYFMNDAGTVFPCLSHKAYLMLPTSLFSSIAKAQVIRLNTSTSIYCLDNTQTDRPSATYNLAGQRVSGTTKGLLISSGRKFFNK